MWRPGRLLLERWAQRHAHACMPVQRACCNAPTFPAHPPRSIPLHSIRSDADLEAALKEQLVLRTVSTLCKHGLLQTDEDSFGLVASEAGKLMAQ